MSNRAGLFDHSAEVKVVKLPIPDEIWNCVKANAALEGKRVGDWVVEAILERLENAPVKPSIEGVIIE